jgi:hypothetical protein
VKYQLQVQQQVPHRQLSRWIFAQKAKAKKKIIQVLGTFYGCWRKTAKKHAIIQSGVN